MLLEEFGEQKVKFTEEYFEKYGTDWYKEIKPDPLAIFFPESESDLKNVVLFANKRNQPIVISGGRTGLCGGATAANKELIVSLEKMNKIEWSDEKKQVVCEAGAITDVVKDFEGKSVVDLLKGTPKTSVRLKILRQGKTKTNLLKTRARTGKL